MNLYNASGAHAARKLSGKTPSGAVLSGASSILAGDGPFGFSIVSAIANAGTDWDELMPQDSMPGTPSVVVLEPEMVNLGSSGDGILHSVPPRLTRSQTSAGGRMCGGRPGAHQVWEG